MFWARNEILHSLRNLQIDEKEYTVKHDQFDGAIPHAVERLFGVVAIHHEKKSWLY
jgi:lipopolysaccharide biosynthesis protein